MVTAMSMSFAEIFTHPPIMGVTINTVALSHAARVIIYAAMGTCFIAGLAYFLSRSAPVGTALRKALLLSFFGAGLLAAVHADTGWWDWVSRDYEELGGLSSEGKVSRLEGQLYDFDRRARDVLRDTYRIFASDGYLAYRSEYFLLPYRKAQDDGRDVVVIGDRDARYDPKTRTFTRDKVQLQNMDLVLNYAPQVYVLRGP